MSAPSGFEIDLTKDDDEEPIPDTEPAPFVPGARSVADDTIETGMPFSLVDWT